MSNFSPSGFIANEFQQYNIDVLYNSTLHLLQLFSSRQEPLFVMASQLTLIVDSTVNTKSTQRAFGFFLPAEYSFMYTCYQRGVVVLGVWSIFLPFIIKRILGIKRIFPCSFGNTCMHLLTRVDGMSTHSCAYMLLFLVMIH